jgi:hypothetical protein
MGEIGISGVWETVVWTLVYLINIVILSGHSTTWERKNRDNLRQYFDRVGSSLSIKYLDQGEKLAFWQLIWVN